jgi:hypothetical protein
LPSEPIGHDVEHPPGMVHMVRVARRHGFPGVPGRVGCRNTKIARIIDTRPGGDLRGILADAIAATACDLDLQPGKSPSSTVIIFRCTASHADCLVLGDSLAVLAWAAVPNWSTPRHGYGGR